MPKPAPVNPLLAFVPSSSVISCPKCGGEGVMLREEHGWSIPLECNKCKGLGKVHEDIFYKQDYSKVVKLRALY